MIINKMAVNRMLLVAALYFIVFAVSTSAEGNDNCLNNGTQCHAHSTCHDIIDGGGIECLCDEGYIGDGKGTCESIFSKTYALVCTEGAMEFTYNKGSTIDNLVIHVLKNGVTEHSKNLLSHGESSNTASACHTNTTTSTTLVVNLNYAVCAGDAVQTTQDGDLIKRIATVEVAQNDLHAHIRRSFEHNKYKLTCTFDRKRNLTAGFQETSAIPQVEEITKNGSATFALEMKFYESGSFDTAKAGSIEVAIDEPIYVGIKKVNEDVNLKMVVQNCWATDTEESSAHQFKYMFINDRCGLDRTYRTITEDDNTYRFQINTFRFVQMKRNVYLHCSLHICKADSGLAACTHGCSSTRKRRAIESDSEDVLIVSTRVRRETEEVAVQYTTSPLIRYMEKETCLKKSCPAHSRCVNSFPAFCRCDTGFVMHHFTQQCTNQTVFHVSNFRMSLNFIDAYLNPNSMPFLELAHRFQKKMLSYYLTEMHTGITGLKVTEMMKGQGSVIFRVAFIRDPQISEDQVIKKINHLHKIHSVDVYERIRLIPQTYIVPYAVNTVSSASKKHTESQTSTWVIVTAAVGALCVTLLCVILVVFFRKRKVVVIATDGDAKKNQAFEMDA